MPVGQNTSSCSRRRPGRPSHGSRQTAPPPLTVSKPLAVPNCCLHRRIKIEQWLTSAPPLLRATSEPAKPASRNADRGNGGATPPAPAPSHDGPVPRLASWAPADPARRAAPSAPAAFRAAAPRLASSPKLIVLRRLSGLLCGLTTSPARLVTAKSPPPNSTTAVSTRHLHRGLAGVSNRLRLAPPASRPASAAAIRHLA